ncbi:hypothetical protein GE061_004912 [Apolygus lucorum]|uniref:Uncharacterized protein n=1 Tax=Apolygus lucorum TaxID=248454 RepID=A0A8S9WW70_APOLU|nr:hypothetical protein GE061_004912 [Apolygus lucorum]
MDNNKLGVALFLLVTVAAVHAGDMLRKSIVFDKKTPGVFYCPQHKPSGLDKMIVRARPLKKLCEFDGKTPLPEDYKSDCYNDIDESDYACKEKSRIMKRLKEPKEQGVMRLHPPGSDETTTSTTEPNKKWRQRTVVTKYIKRKQRVRKQPSPTPKKRE